MVLPSAPHTPACPGDPSHGSFFWRRITKEARLAEEVEKATAVSGEGGEESSSVQKHVGALAEKLAEKDSLAAPSAAEAGEAV